MNAETMQLLQSYQSFIGAVMRSSYHIQESLNSLERLTGIQRTVPHEKSPLEQFLFHHEDYTNYIKNYTYDIRKSLMDILVELHETSETTFQYMADVLGDDVIFDKQRWQFIDKKNGITIQV